MTWFDSEKFERMRAQRGVPWGRPVRLLDSTSSTNDLALEAISTEAKTGIVWIAREQTKGRGRRGNSWQAAPGDCLMLSTLLRYEGAPEPLSGLSLVVGLAVRDVIAPRLPQGQIEALIKWPNDVLVGGKKIAGVLIETRRAKSGELGVVIGLGLNTETDRFPDDLPQATSLKLLGADEASRGPELLTLDLLDALCARVTVFLARGISAFETELCAGDALLGKRLRVTIKDAQTAIPEGIVGVGAGLDARGNLLLETESSTCVVQSGHVELLPD